MPKYNEELVVHMISKLTTEQCKTKLQTLLKGRFSLSEFSGKIEDNKFEVKHFNSDNFGIRYSPPLLKGVLEENQNGTVINGQFQTGIFVNFLEKFAITWALIIGGILFILALLDVLIGTNIIEDDFLAILFLPIFIVAVIGIVKFSVRLRQEDREAILNMLRDKLEVENSEEKY